MTDYEINLLKEFDEFDKRIEEWIKDPIIPENLKFKDIVRHAEEKKEDDAKEEIKLTEKEEIKQKVEEIKIKKEAKFKKIKVRNKFKRI